MEHAFIKIKGGIPQDILIIPCGGEQVEFFVNAALCRKINRKFIFILDSDKGATDYDSKLVNKAALINKVAELGGEFDILRKREIENYYSRAAIQRLFGEEYILPEEFQILDYCDVKEEIKTHIHKNSTRNFKAKNNFEIFNEMTREEWIECGFSIGDSTDIEIMIDKILE